MTDWMMIRRNPRIRHRMHQAKPLDAEVCVIDFKRRQLMCLNGMQSFVMWRLVGCVPHLHSRFSKRVCHMRTCKHLQMKTNGFDLLSILGDFYVVHPDRYWTQENDLDRIAWTLVFGREFYSRKIENNEQNALVVARVGYQNENSISELVLAMLDGDLSFEILCRYPQKDIIYYNIAWVIAFLKQFQVPHNPNIFPFLKSLYTEMKEFSSNYIQKFSILPSDNISWVSSLLLDAIFAMSEIVGFGTGISKCQFRKGDRTMEYQFLTDLGIHLWCSMSLSFKYKKEKGLTKKKKPLFWGPPSVESQKSSYSKVVLTRGDLQVVLTHDWVFKLVQDGNITIACTELKESHPQHFTEIVFANNPKSGFVSMWGPEVKFWAIDNHENGFQQGRIFLSDTLHLQKIIGPDLMIDVCSISSNYIILWSLRTSELFVIPFTFTGSTVSIGEKTIFPFERVRDITLIDERNMFNICFRLEGSREDYFRILDCSGELPIL